MSLAAKLRVAGWIVSLTGAAALVFGGGFSSETQIVSMAGAVVMVLGIILTSTAPLVSAVQERRRLSEAMAKHKDGRPDTPVKPG